MKRDRFEGNGRAKAGSRYLGAEKQLQYISLCLLRGLRDTQNVLLTADTGTSLVYAPRKCRRRSDLAQDAR